MKHGKRLTVEMKIFLGNKGLDSKEYLIVKNTPHEYVFVNVNTKEEISFKKEVK